MTWLDAGFPGPDGTVRGEATRSPEREAADDAARENAPCCLDVRLVADGWIGIGNTQWPRADRDQFYQDHPVTLEPYRTYDEQECENLPWRFDNEVWFSLDGVSWGQITDSGFGENGLDSCKPRSLLLSAGGGRSFVAGAGGVWTSADLRDWTHTISYVQSPGTVTYIDSVVVTDAGWMILGIRMSDPPRSPTGGALRPYRTEWVSWVSSDAVTWETFDLTALVGEPCQSHGPSRCASIEATATEDAIIAYIEDQSVSFGPGSGWVLWVGLLPNDSPVA